MYNSTLGTGTEEESDQTRQYPNVIEPDDDDVVDNITFGQTNDVVKSRRTRNRSNVILTTIDLWKTTDDENGGSSGCKSLTSRGTGKKVVGDEVSKLSEILPTVCTLIFERLGSQQTESTYQNCLQIELEELGFRVVSEPEIQLRYKGIVVGTRRPDLVVTDQDGKRSLLELKAVDEMTPVHMRQIQFYLHHTNIGTGYLINFPHDSSFAAVDDKSTFEASPLSGMNDRMQGVVSGLGQGPILANSPGQREVEVVKVNRREMTDEERLHAVMARKQQQEMVSKSTTSTQVYGITKTGTPCKNCIKIGDYCHQHIRQRPS